MELEEQVTSLEISKQLNELGVKQDSLFWWSTDTGSNFFVETESYPVYADYPRPKRIYSAFTLSELGAMLNWNIHFEGVWYLINTYKIISENYVRYSNGHGRDLLILHDTMDINEANARAKMLIYLIENKLIEV